jgi:uncharacterized protein YciI
MSEVQDEVKELSERMLQKILYVVLTTPVRPMSDLAEFLPQHLKYLIDLEKRGILFASGPFLPDEQVVAGTGMTILRASSREEAEAIAREDPFNKSGMRTFEIRMWQLNEGSFTVTINYSDQSYGIR